MLSKGVHKTSFPKFTGKYSRRSLLFNKVKGSELATLLQKDFFYTGVVLCLGTPSLRNTFQEQSPGRFQKKKNSVEKLTEKTPGIKACNFIEKNSSTGVLQ